MKNNVWLVGFLAKKKLLWLIGIVLAVYFILLPYQKNLLLYVGGYRDVKGILGYGLSLSWSAVADICISGNVPADEYRDRRDDRDVFWKQEIYCGGICSDI